MAFAIETVSGGPGLLMEVIQVQQQSGHLLPLDESTATFLDMDFCRLCLIRGDGQLISVFNAELAVEGREPLNARIHRFFEVAINENDLLPTQICGQCLLQTESCTEFRENCIQNDRRLRQLIFSGNSQEMSILSLEATSEMSYRKTEESTVDEKSQDPEDVSLEGEEQEDDPQDDIGPEDEEELPETIVIDPMKDYESSNQSVPEAFSDEDDPEDRLVMDEITTEDMKMENTNDSSEDVPEEENRPMKKIVHMCKYCDVAFALSSACYVHETQDHDILAPFGCPFCEFKTVNRGSLISHIRSIHGIDRPYICIQCNKGFHRRSDLKKHTFVHSGVRPFACEECGKSFSRNTNLTKHLRIHSGFKPHICSTCPRSFANKADLLRHQNIHMSLGKQFSCSKCNNTYARKDKLLSHQRTCFAKAQLKQQLQRQLDPQNIAHTTDSLLIGSKGAWPEYDGENMVISLNPYQEIEPIAAEEDPGIPNAAPISAVSNFSNVTLQQSTPAGGSSSLQTKLYSCQKCPKKFLSKNTLHTHQLIHSDARNYRCHTCDKKFIRKRELDRHLIAVHSNHKPFECKQCSKRFSRKDKLLRHERVHRVDKLFSCTDCDAQFLRKEALDTHRKIHSIASIIREDQHRQLFQQQQQPAPPSSILPSDVIIMIDQGASAVTPGHEQLMLEQMLSAYGASGGGTGGGTLGHTGDSVLL
ncbi:zinc finger protein 271-like [Uranotaenia lowii]|uniref:zinc finger protein 271-like n=1 Tax=Uranotaenia lowii TaxID=190385 RepID=UPI00247AE533|nr:zinc finger protein 271-like [Uranotaenia lowii]